MKFTILRTVPCIMAAMLTLNGAAQEKKTTEEGYIVVDHQKETEMKTILGDKGKHGAYISFDMGFGKLGDEEVIELGGRLAWVINHGLAIGIAGQGIINRLDPQMIDPYNEEDEYSLTGGYGGLLVEPILWPKKVVNVSFPLLIGAGGASYTDRYFENWTPKNSDAYFVLRPGIEMQLNIAKNFRIAFGGYYRLTHDFEIEGLDSDYLNGFSGGISFKLGWF